MVTISREKHLVQLRCIAAPAQEYCAPGLRQWAGASASMQEVTLAPNLLGLLTQQLLCPVRTFQSGSNKPFAAQHTHSNIEPTDQNCRPAHQRQSAAQSCCKAALPAVQRHTVHTPSMCNGKGAVDSRLTASHTSAGQGPRLAQKRLGGWAWHESACMSACTRVSGR
jgi:hypothetical protein